jgi:hypothetical protein
VARSEAIIDKVDLSKCEQECAEPASKVGEARAVADEHLERAKYECAQAVRPRYAAVVKRLVDAAEALQRAADAESTFWQEIMQSAMGTSHVLPRVWFDGTQRDRASRSGVRTESRYTNGIQQYREQYPEIAR